MEKHRSVLLQEVQESFSYLSGAKSPVFVDGTIGAGGHAFIIAKAYLNSGTATLLGIDKDQSALALSENKLKGLNLKFLSVNAPFEDISDILKDYNVDKIDGMLVDLGVSSMQLDESTRGFSFMQNALLDMRMDQIQDKTAANILNTYSEDKLVKLFFEYGEEQYSRKIAKKIVESRKPIPLKTTFELRDLILSVIPEKEKHRKIHPATNIFRALRMEVNDEVVILSRGLVDGVNSLKSGSRLAVISFHSIEDRIVKQTFQKLHKPCICNSRQPICQCGYEPIINIVTKKPIVASAAEVKSNPRARSAKLRIVEKV